MWRLNMAASACLASLPGSVACRVDLAIWHADSCRRAREPIGSPPSLFYPGRHAPDECGTRELSIYAAFLLTHTALVFLLVYLVTLLRFRLLSKCPRRLPRAKNAAERELLSGTAEPACIYCGDRAGRSEGLARCRKCTFTSHATCCREDDKRGVNSPFLRCPQCRRAGTVVLVN